MRCGGGSGCGTAVVDAGDGDGVDMASSKAITLAPCTYQSLKL